MIQRTRSLLRLACAGTAVLLAACASLGSLPSPAPSPGSPVPRPAASAVPPSGSAGVSQAGTPEQAAAFIARVVPAQYPRLLPGFLPPGMSAQATAGDYGYEVGYDDDLHTRHITFASGMGMNPPPATSDHAASRQLQFRGTRASYVVYDSTAPMSQRYLHWFEPGTWPRFPAGLPSSECFLAAGGLTEAEFLQVADSLRRVG